MMSAITMAAIILSRFLFCGAEFYTYVGLILGFVFEF
jgi:hypothetical protein